MDTDSNDGGLIMNGKNGIVNRRTFVSLGAGMGAMAAASSADAKEESGKGGMKYRELGKTGLKVSEVSFGTYGFNNPGLLEDAIDKGVNLICTAAEYQNGVAEEAIGKVMKARRKDVILFSGWTVRPNKTKKELLAILDKSLKRLNTDCIDIIKIHNIDDPKLLDYDMQYEAFEEAKKAGKTKFYSVSCHGGNLEKVLTKAIEKKTIDVIQCKYNFMEYASQMALFEKAAKQGIGIVAFKVEAGKRQNEVKDLEEKGLTHHQASVRWALLNKNVGSVCATFTNFNHIKQYLEAVSKQFSQADADHLRRYTAAVDQSYCRYCSTCEPNCPHGVAVADVMRYAMYFKYYKMEKEAMRLYAQMPLGQIPDACEQCPGHCLDACPHKRPVRDGLIEAKGMLA